MGMGKCLILSVVTSDKYHSKLAKITNSNPHKILSFLCGHECGQGGMIRPSPDFAGGEMAEATILYPGCTTVRVMLSLGVVWLECISRSVGRSSERLHGHVTASASQSAAQ